MCSEQTYVGYFWELNAWQLLDEFHEGRSRQSAILKVITQKPLKTHSPHVVETMHAAHASDLIRPPLALSSGEASLVSNKAGAFL